MNPIKRLLGHIYFVYALLLFLLTMCVVVVPVIAINLIYKKQEYARSRAIHTTYRIWMTVYMALIGCRVTVRGQSHFQKGAQYVVILNHQSLADIPISTPWVPGANKTLAKIDFMKIPIFNIIYKAGSILVDRRSEESRKASIHKMVHTLHQGMHLVLYPEGTRNKSEQPLQPFQNGAFKVALLAQKNIIPGILSNTNKLLPNTPAVWAWPQRIYLDFLPPIQIENYQSTDVTILKDDAYAQMLGFIHTRSNVKS